MRPNRTKYLIVITGPTAIGKTAISIRLAEQFHTEIISADSRQIYRELDIGVAKPSLTETTRIRHHFINHTSIADIYSVGQFEREAMSFLNDFFKSRDVIVCAGGSGLYIDALRFGLDTFPDVTPASRSKYEAIYATEGIAPLQELLKECDPMYYQQVDLQNSARLIRALSVFDSSGLPFSSFLTKSTVKRPFDVIPIVLTRDRPQLYDRINARVDQMMVRGLLKEVEELMVFRHLQTLKTVGYQEFFPYFDGEVSLESAVEKLKQKTRNYAKRQVTWFQKHGPWKAIEADNYQSVIDYVTERMTDKAP